MHTTITTLNRSLTAQENLHATNSLVAEFSQQSLTRNGIATNLGTNTSRVIPAGCLTSEKKSYEYKIDSDVKQKVALNFEKAELENKLADMANTILDFKNQYGLTESVSSLHSQ